MEYVNGTPEMVSIANELLQMNPQIPAAVTKQKQTYYFSDMMDYEFVNTVNDRLHLSNYYCIVCECDYDSFPPRELVIRHLKTCLGIAKLNA